MMRCGGCGEVWTEGAACPACGSDKTNPLDKLIQDRGAAYGPWKANMELTGQAVGTLIEQHYRIKLDHPIPGFLMALIMVQVKLNRAANPKFTKDTFDDAHNYLRFAEELQSNG